MHLIQYRMSRNILSESFLHIPAKTCRCFITACFRYKRDCSNEQSVSAYVESLFHVCAFHVGGGWQDLNLLGTDARTLLALPVALPVKCRLLTPVIANHLRFTHAAASVDLCRSFPTVTDSHCYTAIPEALVSAPVP
ncbi:hypothetical protein SAMN05216325_1408 [Nitrosomonas marina]|uniref:Uncharacterized protein n=1 Tax=Nitrosomonas marina TaxID=917 RepID=A0A1H8IT36_9PROT|nr:hypothetical protein SAMN05216325_1408 [Nitrosomonas marina]